MNSIFSTSSTNQQLSKFSTSTNRKLTNKYVKGYFGNRNKTIATRINKAISDIVYLAVKTSEAKKTLSIPVVVDGKSQTVMLNHTYITHLTDTITKLNSELYNLYKHEFTIKREYSEESIYAYDTAFTDWLENSQNEKFNNMMKEIKRLTPNGYSRKVIIKLIPARFRADKVTHFPEDLYERITRKDAFINKYIESKRQSLLKKYDKLSDTQIQRIENKLEELRSDFTSGYDAFFDKNYETEDKIKILDLSGGVDITLYGFVSDPLRGAKTNKTLQKENYIKIGNLIDTTIPSKEKEKRQRKAVKDERAMERTVEYKSRSGSGSRSRSISGKSPRPSTKLSGSFDKPTSRTSIEKQPSRTGSQSRPASRPTSRPSSEKKAPSPVRNRPTSKVEEEADLDI